MNGRRSRLVVDAGVRRACRCPDDGPGPGRALRPRRAVRSWDCSSANANGDGQIDPRPRTGPRATARCSSGRTRRPFSDRRSAPQPDDRDRRGDLDGDGTTTSCTRASETDVGGSREFDGAGNMRSSRHHGPREPRARSWSISTATATSTWSCSPDPDRVIFLANQDAPRRRLRGRRVEVACPCGMRAGPAASAHRATRRGLPGGRGPDIAGHARLTGSGMPRPTGSCSSP